MNYSLDSNARCNWRDPQKWIYS